MKFKIVFPPCLFFFVLGYFIAPIPSQKEIEEAKEVVAELQDIQESLSKDLALLVEHKRFQEYKSRIETLEFVVSFKKRNAPTEYVMETLNDDLEKSISALGEFNQEEYRDAKYLIERAKQLQEDVRFYYW